MSRAVVSRFARAACALILTAAPGCAALRPDRGHSVSPASRDRLADGRVAESRGDRAAAITAYRAAIAESPDFVDAHRAYQNLVLGDGRHGDLLREYSQWLARDPSSAARTYLLGRLWSDRERQLESFEAAVDLDSELYFAHVGIGWVALDLGRTTRAARAFEAAIEIDADRLDAWRGRLRLLEGIGSDEAREAGVKVARRILDGDPRDSSAERFMLNALLGAGKRDDAFREGLRFALDVGSDDAADLLLELIEKHASSEQIERTRAALAAERADGSLSTAWARLRAGVEARCGDPREALRALAAAPASAAEQEDLAAFRRRLLVACGEIGEYLDETIAHRFARGFDLGDSGAEGELRAARARWGARGEALRGADGAEFVALLLRHGLLEAGIEAGRMLLAEDPTNAPLRERVDEAIAHRRFVAELRDLLLRSYSGESELSLDDFFVEARAVSRRCFGRDVVDPLVTREYFPIGVFLDPDPEHGGGLARHFERYGQFFLVGRRTFGPVDGYLLRGIASGRPEIHGARIWRFVGEDLEIPSRLEHAGGQIAGFALETFIALNVDRARQSAARALALHEARRENAAGFLADDLQHAEGGAQRTALDEPSSVVGRAWYRSVDRFLAAGGEPARYAGVLLDAIESHERAHILDAREFLPVFSDVTGKVALLAEHGFSASGIEAWLEERAQAVALADARDPTAVLADLLRALPDRTASPPHSIGYHDLARRIVALIDSDPDAFPELDRSRVLVQQLDRLGDDGLRRVARRLLLQERSR